jgi:hypothetical protein
MLIRGDKFPYVNAHLGAAMSELHHGGQVTQSGRCTGR